MHVQMGESFLSETSSETTLLDQELLRQEEKVARADDASIHFQLWDDRMWNLQLRTLDSVQCFMDRFGGVSYAKKDAPFNPSPLVTLRHFAVGQWKQNVYRDFCSFMVLNYGGGWLPYENNSVVCQTARDVLTLVTRSNFWEWTDGSALIFWHWPKAQQKYAMEGYPVWIKQELPNIGAFNKLKRI